jgi:hypothetical protein
MQAIARKHDLTRVVGPCNEEAPTLLAGTEIPELRPDRLSSGEVVYRMMPETEAKGTFSGTDGLPARSGQSVSTVGDK